MTYIKRDIKDRITEFPRRYKQTLVGGTTDTFDLVPVTGNVVQEGTPINKAYLQPIEDTLEDITTPKYGVATGTNSYVVTVPKITALVIGLQLMVKFTNASTGATFINVNSLGNKSLIKAGGGSPRIKANGIYTIGYDGTSFQLLGEGGEYGTAQASDVLAPKTIGTDDGLVTGTIATFPSFPVATDFHPYGTGSADGGNNIYLKMPSGYSNGSHWLSFKDPNLIPANVKAGVSIGAGMKLNGTFTSDATIPDASWMLTGASAYKNGAKIEGSMLNHGAVTLGIGTQGGVAYIPGGFHNGNGYVQASFANLVAGNIKNGVNVGGVVGSYKPSVVRTLFGIEVASGLSDEQRWIPPSTSKVVTFNVGVTPQAVLMGYPNQTTYVSLPWTGKLIVNFSYDNNLYLIAMSCSGTIMTFTFKNEATGRHQAYGGSFQFYHAT